MSSGCAPLPRSPVRPPGVMSVSAPSVPIANPEMLEPPALAVYAKRPRESTISQHGAACPPLETELLTAMREPSRAWVYEDADADPASDTTSAPFGVNWKPNGPGPADALLIGAPRLACSPIRKASIVLLPRSVTSSQRPLGLTRTSLGPDVFALSAAVPRARRLPDSS